MNKRLTYKELEENFTHVKGELAIRDVEVNKIKSTFLSNVSHEIRTPMNVIVGFSNLLNDPTYDQEQKGFFIDEINKNSKELLRLIDNILLCSKVEDENVELNLQPVDLNSLTTYLHRHFNEKLKNANKSITLKLISDKNNNQTVFTDKEILKDALNNIIDNASKYAINGSLEFGYRILKEKTVLFFVRDAHPGVNGQNKNSLYSKGNYNNENIMNTEDQHGIGLTISDKLIRSLGGKLTVKSTFEYGSSFNFAIPLLVEKPV